MPEDHTDDERDLLDLAYPFAVDAVSEAERAEINDRLRASAPPTAEAFARIVADTRETLALVGGSDALAPPHELRDRIMSAVDSGPVESDTDDVARRRALRRRRLTRALVAAAAVVVVGVGVAVGVGQFSDRAPTVPTVDQVIASPDVHTFTADVAGGTITLSSSAEENAVVVSMTDVAPPPSGHVYQMWFVPESGAPRSAGTMSADTMPPPGGSVIPELDSAASVAVTVEPGTGSPQPTGEPVVTIPLV